MSTAGTPICPLCRPARPLVPVDPGVVPPLWRCGGCNGIWASATAAREARDCYRGHSILLQPSAATLCRRCRKKIGHASERCESCGASQAIGCLDCGKPMARVRVRTVIVDLCRPCRFTWLDAGELALLLRPEEDSPAISRGLLPPDGLSPATMELLDPAAELVARGAVEVTTHVVVKAVEGGVEVAVEVVGGALAGLFDGL